MKAPNQIGCAGSLIAGLVFCFLVPAAVCAPSREITEDAFSAQAQRVTAERGADALVSTIEFPAQEARLVRLVIRRPHSGEPCLDEIEIYGPDSSTNLALASRGAIARASSLLPGYAIHAVAHLNDGLYGNDHSWIAATAGEEWVEIELPEPARIDRVLVSRDRNGQFKDRQILEAEVRLSVDGKSWQTAGTLKRSANQLPRSGPQLTFPVAELTEPTWAGAVTYAFLRERDTWSRMDAKDYLSPLVNDRPAMPGGQPYWGRLSRLTPLERTLVQFEEMIARLEALGLDGRTGSGLSSPICAGRRRIRRQRLRTRFSWRRGRPSDRLFFRDPRLAPIEHVLFAKRHPAAALAQLQRAHGFACSPPAEGSACCIFRAIPRGD